MGSRVLDWLRHLDGLDEKHIVSRQFTLDLCWFLVSENKDKLVVDWLMQEGKIFCSQTRGQNINALYHREDKIGHLLRRRHDLTTSHVAAHLCLSSDGTATDALKAFCAIKSMALDVRITNAFVWAVSTGYLKHHLESGTCMACDAKALDDFCYLMRFNRNPKIYQIQHAYLKLYHPRLPDPWPALSFVKQHMDELDFQIMKPATPNHYGHILMRTMVILRMQGEAAEAQWAELTLRDRFPKVWFHSDKTIAELRKDPKLQHLLNQTHSETQGLGQSGPFPEKRTVAEVGELLASFRRKVENSDTSLTKRRGYNAANQFGSKVLQ